MKDNNKSGNKTTTNFSDKEYQDKLNEQSHGDQNTTNPGGKLDIGMTGGVTQSDNRDKDLGDASRNNDVNSPEDTNNQ